MTRLAAPPRLEVHVGGRALPSSALESLVRVRVHRELGQPSQCELVWFSPTPAVTEGISGGPGTTLGVRGAASAPALFEGEVTAVEHDYGSDARHVLRVRGYDRLHRLRQSSQLRAHVEVTAESLARELCAGLGLTVSAAWTGPHLPYLIQHRENDLDLLADVAARAGLYPLLDGDVLRLDGLEGRGDPIPLKLGAELVEAAFEINAARACRSVTAHAWDPLRPLHSSATARRARVGRSVDAEVAPERVHADPERHLINVAARSEDDAQGLAAAELDRRTAAQVVFRGLCSGESALVPGCLVEVAGVAPELAGRYVLTAVTHRLDAERGFVSEISTEPPRARCRPAGAAATIGVVTQVADPERRGRVRVRLPTYGDVETDWMRVAAPGAGRRRGLVALPAIDDEVLVLLSNGDPARGVVLGGLFGETAPEDLAVKGDDIQRFSLTTGGHRIVLDEATGALRLENDRGSRVELGREGLSVHAETDLVVEAPGHRLLFRAASVDFEEAR